MEDIWRIRKWYSVHCTVHYIVYIYSYNVRVIGEGFIQDVIKKRMNSSYSSNRPAWCKIASATRNLINSVPQTAATILAFSSVYIHTSSVVRVHRGQQEVYRSDTKHLLYSEQCTQYCK